MSVSYPATTSGLPMQIEVLASQLYQGKNAGGDPNGGYTTGVFDNATLSYTATPEPATLTLLASGLVGLLAYASRRRRA